MPQPDGPAIETNSPGATLRFTPDSAWVSTSLPRNTLPRPLSLMMGVVMTKANSVRAPADGNPGRSVAAGGCVPGPRPVPRGALPRPCGFGETFHMPRHTDPVRVLP